jgi:hypothetical protein
MENGLLETDLILFPPSVSYVFLGHTAISTMIVGKHTLTIFYTALEGFNSISIISILSIYK